MATGGIRAAGTKLTRAMRAMDELARHMLTHQYKRREDARKRPRSKMGTYNRKAMFGGLYGLWLDLPGVRSLPGVARSGPFVRFAQRFCRVVADHIETEVKGPARKSHWRGLVAQLRRVERDGEAVRDGIRKLGRAFARVSSSTNSAVTSAKRRTKKP